MFSGCQRGTGRGFCSRWRAWSWWPEQRCSPSTWCARSTTRYCGRRLPPGKLSISPPPAWWPSLDAFADRAEQTLRAWIGENRVAILLLAFLTIVIKNLFAFLARFASARFGLATIRDLRELFFESLLGQSPAFFHDRSTAALVSRATNDFQLLREALAERLGDVAQDLVTVPLTPCLSRVPGFPLDPGDGIRCAAALRPSRPLQPPVAGARSSRRRRALTKSRC